MAEGEVKRLTENLELEKTRNAELEKKLESLKLSCTCSQPKSTDVALSEEETSKHGVELIGVYSTNFDKVLQNKCRSTVATFNDFSSQFFI